MAYNVAATIKVMPEGPETDLEELKANLKASMPTGSEINNIVEEPIGFGIKAIMVTALLNDDEGGTEPIEEAFSKVKGVESVMVIDVGRLG